MEAEEGRDTARAAARAAAEAMPIIPEDNDAQTYVWLAITYFVMEAAAAGRGAVRQAAAAGRGAVRQAAALAEAMNRARRNLVEDYAPYALLLTVFYFVLCAWALKVLEIVGWHFDWALPAVVALLSAVMLLLGMRINDAQAYGLLAITCLATVAWALKVLEIVGWHFDWALPAVVALLSAVMLLLGCHVREVLFLIIWESLCFNGCCAMLTSWLSGRAVIGDSEAVPAPSAPAAGAPAAGAPAADAPAAGAPAAGAPAAGAPAADAPAAGAPATGEEVRL